MPATGPPRWQTELRASIDWSAAGFHFIFAEVIENPGFITGGRVRPPNRGNGSAHDHSDNPAQFVLIDDHRSTFRRSAFSRSEPGVRTPAIADLHLFVQ